MYYSSFGTLSLILTLIISHGVLTARKRSGAAPTKLMYRDFLLCVLGYYVSDIIWGFLYEAHLVALTYACTVIYFLLMTVSVLLWTRYVVAYLGKRSVLSNMMTYVGWLILIYQIVMLIVNAFSPVMFYFDADGVYHPGGARYVTLVVQIALFLATSAYTLATAAKTKGKQRRHHRTIGFSGLVMTAFVVLQTFFSLLPFYAVGCLIASSLVHAFITEDEKKDHYRELGTAKHMAYTDSLTGVKNPHAYTEAKAEIDRSIEAGALKEFAVAVFDLNGLKKINDTEGHDAGDRYIESACALICGQFKRSPVYRIGGDEFVAFLTGDDYRNREVLLAEFDRRVENNQKHGFVVVSSGVSEFVPGEDNDYNAVFERADQLMYERKRELKAMPRE